MKESMPGVLTMIVAGALVAACQQADQAAMDDAMDDAMTTEGAAELEQEVSDLWVEAGRPIFVIIVPLKDEEGKAIPVTVNGNEYSNQATLVEDRPDVGPFTLSVNGAEYAVGLDHPGGQPLWEVFVIGGKVTAGLYREHGVPAVEDLTILAAKTCECRACSNGEIVCGCDPKCPVGLAPR